MSEKPEGPKNNIFIPMEQEMLEHWNKNQTYAKVKKKGEGKKKFYFLDGPPYTSGRVHLGTAWNKTLKDMVLRYKRMNGLDVWDRAGYDMHGMPTAQAVQKKLNLPNKDDILKYGMDKFVKECEDFSITNMKKMNEDFKRLGVWMDFENAYYTANPKYIESCWWLIKKADENKRLYLGEKTMHWCAKCGTALAKHELEYKNVRDDSIFLKFKVLGSENEYLIIWTTTPWTIPFNLGVMVNPDLDYVKIKVNVAKEGEEEKLEQWVVAKGLVGAFMGSVVNKKYEMIEEVKGETLEGIKYRHPLHDEIPESYDELDKNHDKTFSVVLSSQFVDLSAGTGLVHMAPGCGPEDYEVGRKNNIPPFNNLNEAGEFPEDFGCFGKWKAKKDDKKFIEKFKEMGFLIESTEVEHDYAHCWRCKEPVIFRTTKQWFFKIEDMKETMRELNKDIYWNPEFAGSKSFDSWLANLRDNGITRQRFWGTPLPVWKCSKKDDEGKEVCDNYVVIGSVKELEEKVGKENVPENLHKPWIDDVKFKCDKCAAEMVREPDILDVWIDAGVDSWACLDYPHREDLMKEMYPAEFIMEGIDQIRGWFNMLFVSSMVAMEKPSYKAVYMHGFINDAQGRKMSKSEGNYILPEEVIESYGSETLRYYMIGGAKPGIDLNYNFDDMKVKFRNLGILWNLHKFMIDLKNNNNLEVGEVDKDKLGLGEKYILSKLNSTIVKVTEMYEKYLLNEIPTAIEELFLELSRTYVQMVRDKANSGSEEDKQLVLNVLFKVINETLKMLAPVCPMVTDKIYLNLKEEFNLDEESVHLIDWPKADENLIDEKIEKNIETAKDVIQAVLSAREKAKLGVRWPLKNLIFVSPEKELRDAVKEMNGMIKTQTNVKEVGIGKEYKAIKIKIKPNYKTIGVKYADDVAQIITHLVNINENTVMNKIKEKGCYEFSLSKKEFKLLKEDLIIEKVAPEGVMEGDSKKGDVYIDVTRTPELDSEGYAREIMRRIQTLRKNAGLQKNDDIKLCVFISTELLEIIEKYEDEIKDKCGVKEFYIGEEKKEFKDVLETKIKGKDIWLSLEKV
ncbi:isoleucine--tRNA ligase [Candidatus Woesearchaeota archaeon]|jgi:isoleucyl-tRNA synthetase|nr:isoleucine--tRNA ligase [Candidatus Woesearchaeota archaeon]